MLKIDITKQAKKFLDNLPSKQFRQVAKKIFSLMENPLPNDSIKMKGYPFRRVDIGEYRIVYRVDNDCVKLAIIGKRNDSEIYQKLKRIG